MNKKVLIISGSPRKGGKGDGASEGNNDLLFRLRSGNSDLNVRRPCWDTIPGRAFSCLHIFFLSEVRVWIILI